MGDQMGSKFSVHMYEILKFIITERTGIPIALPASFGARASFSVKRLWPSTVPVVSICDF